MQAPQSKLSLNWNTHCPPEQGLQKITYTGAQSIRVRPWLRPFPGVSVSVFFAAVKS